MAAVPGSNSCGSTAAEASTVVTVAQAPARRSARSPHWLIETTTVRTLPGQPAGSALWTAAPCGPAVVAQPASASRTASSEASVARRTCATTDLLTDND